MQAPQRSINKRNRGYDSGCNGNADPQHKKLKQIRKSIQFSPKVTMRCLLQTDCQEQEQQQDEKVDVDENRSRAKALAKLRRSKNSTLAAATGTMTSAVSNANTIPYAVRSEMEGESLRGLEHITNASIGRMRNRVREDAIQTAMAEQQEQLIEHVLDAAHSIDKDSSIESEVKSQAIKMDKSKLARVYGSKTRLALVYAKRVAKEDAAVAAEILAEDLKLDSSTSSRLPTSCNSPSLDFSSVKRSMQTEGHNMTHEFILSLLQNILVNNN